MENRYNLLLRRGLEALDEQEREYYNISAHFSQSIQSLSRGGDPLIIIKQLCETIDEQHNMLKEMINKGFSPPFHKNNDNI